MPRQSVPGHMECRSWAFRGRNIVVVAGLSLLAWQSFIAMPGAAAGSPGSSAASAIPIAASGRFAGTVAPLNSTWFRVVHLGGDQESTFSVTFLPAESSRVSLALFKGPPDALRPHDGTSDTTDNTLTWTFTEPSRRDLLLQILNDHQDRAISFVGRITPSGTIEGPPRGTPIPSMGPVADTPDVALDPQPDGSFVGILEPRQVVWFRAYYGAAGYTSTISAAFTPSTGNANLDVYSGPDAGHLTQQLDAPSLTQTGLARQVSLPTQQWFYFTLSNSSATVPLGYVGQLTPVFIAPQVVAPTPTPVPPTPTPVPTPRPVPVVSHDQRYFAETRFRVDDDVIWSYFQSRGQIETFGFPVSRTFMFLGCPVQIFQRQVIQICPGRPPALLNLLDPEIFSYNRVNGSVFPEADEALKAATPRVGDPDYATAVLDFMRANAPEGVDLEVWGAPISRAQADPSNADFVYQRFQRGILHRILSQGTVRGILLADYLKAILLDRDVPTDLRAQAQGSRFLGQYCPTQPAALCRPAELEATDLSFAFETG